MGESLKGETPSGGLWGGNNLRSDIHHRITATWRQIMEGPTFGRLKNHLSNRLVWKGENIGLEDASSTNITV